MVDVLRLIVVVVVVVVVVLAIFEQMGLPKSWIGFIFLLATVGLYAGIGIITGPGQNNTDFAIIKYHGRVSPGRTTRRILPGLTDAAAHGRDANRMPRVARSPSAHSPRSPCSACVASRKQEETPVLLNVAATFSAMGSMPITR